MLLCTMIWLVISGLLHIRECCAHKTFESSLSTAIDTGPQVKCAVFP